MTRLFLPQPPSQPCADCGQNAEPYMVGARTWRRAGGVARLTHKAPSPAEKRQAATGKRLARDPARKGAPRFLCLACLESRLDRPLRPADFLRRPINRWVTWRRGKRVPVASLWAWRSI